MMNMSFLFEEKREYMIDKIKFSLLFFVVVFIGFYILYYLIFDDKLKKEKYTKISELVLLTKKFNLDKKKMDYRKCLKGVALINAFIIAFTVVVVDLIGLNNLIWFPIALVMLFGLIIILYFTYGKICEKKWGKK